MAINQPVGEQILFNSSSNGATDLDTYLEAAERGGRALGDLLSDIFDGSGNLLPGYLEFQITAAGKLQYRVAGTGAWLDLQDIFVHQGTWSTSTAYNRTDTVVYSGNIYVCVADHTSDPSAFATDSAYWVQALSLAGNPVYYRGTFAPSGGSYPASPSVGDLYMATDAGTIGAEDYEAGDFALYNGSSWEKMDANSAPPYVLQSFVFTASGGETGFTGADDNAQTLSYTAGNISVFLNGVKLTPNVDYTASDGSSIGSLSALSASDVLVIEAYQSFAVADAVPLAGGTMTGGLIAPQVTSTGDVTVQTDTTNEGLISKSSSGATHIWSIVRDGTDMKLTSFGSFTVYVNDSGGLGPGNGSLALSVDSSGNLSTEGSIQIKGGIPVNQQTGTTYTLVLTDAGKIVECNNASAITLTIPLNSSVAFAVGTIITIEQTGAGQVTISPTGGVTMNEVDGNTKTKGQYGVVSLRKTDTDTWTLYGATAA